MYRRILVPLDGSRTGESILPHVSRLARAVGAELVLVNVSLPVVTQEELLTQATARAVAGAKTHEAERYLEEQQRALARTGLAVQVQAVKAEQLADAEPAALVANAIAAVAISLDADLIAIASHSYSAYEPRPASTVAAQLLVSASVPVLAVRSR